MEGKEMLFHLKSSIIFFYLWFVWKCFESSNKQGWESHLIVIAFIRAFNCRKRTNLRIIWVLIVCCISKAEALQVFATEFGIMSLIGGFPAARFHSSTLMISKQGNRCWNIGETFAGNDYPQLHLWLLWGSTFSQHSKGGVASRALTSNKQGW